VENARLREAVERLGLLNEDKDEVIAGLRAQLAEQAELIARLGRLISRNSGNSSMPPGGDDQPGRKPPQRRQRQGGTKRRPGK
jgi:transposase